ncbi:beta-galactosidase [Pediococcus siamensis]|uniref:beta-galactosidase n=1 Tax=Pediococcus siamensis TaxID=381829 RepID=UPI0039A21D8A
MNQQVINKVPFLFGGDYNPEQWPESTWEKDIKMVEQAEINSATINVFSWSLLQPKENKYDFTMLDKIVSLLKKHNFKIVMATSTAALPGWMVKKYKDVSRVNTYGIRQGFGKRHNACPNSPNFQKLAEDLVTQIMKRYGQERSVVCWHISNEYGGYCYCDNCAKEFRKWLKIKYTTIENLNNAWNANFWSHTIHEWDEVVPPSKLSDEFDNGKAVLGGEALDYRRFQSDSLLNEFLMEKAVIRKFNKTTPITTNFMGTQEDLDYFKWARHLDVVSWDNYPSFDTTAAFTAMNHDLMYGLKKQPFMLMEQAPSQQNWQAFNALKAPGEIRFLSYQAVAHGANTVQFFQLRQARSGSEKLHSSIISNRDSTQTRVFKEVAQIGTEMKQLDTNIWSSRRKSKVAIIFDWESFWGINSSVGPTVNLHYINRIYAYYKFFYKNNISVDFISDNDNLSTYKIVIAPAHYILKPKLANKISVFVNQGGNFITDFMSNVVDENDNLFQGNGPLDKLLGMWVEERDALTPKNDVELQVMDTGRKTKADVLCDVVHLDGAEILAKFQTSKFYNNYPAITQNKFGKGHAYYVCTALSDETMDWLGKYILKKGKLTISEKNKESVERISRYTDKYQYEFILNTQDREQIYHNRTSDLVDIVSNKKINTGDVHLKPFGVLITRIKLNEDQN